MPLARISSLRLNHEGIKLFKTAFLHFINSNSASHNPVKFSKWTSLCFQIFRTYFYSHLLFLLPFTHLIMGSVSRTDIYIISRVSLSWWSHTYFSFEIFQLVSLSVHLTYCYQCRRSQGNVVRAKENHKTFQKLFTGFWIQDYVVTMIHRHFCFPLYHIVSNSIVYNFALTIFTLNVSQTAVCL